MIQRPDWEAASSRTVRPVTCHTHGCRALEKWVVQNAKWNQTHTGFWILNTKKKSISVKIFIFGLCWNSSLGDLKIVKIISSFFFNLFKCGYQNICHHTWFILYFHWKAPLWNTLGAGRGGGGNTPEHFTQTPGSLQHATETILFLFCPSHLCPLPGCQSLLKTSSIIVFPFFLGPPHFFSGRGKPLPALHCNPALPSRGLSSKFGVFIFTFGNGKSPKPQFAGPQLKLSDSSWPSVPTPVSLPS